MKKLTKDEQEMLDVSTERAKGLGLTTIYEEIVTDQYTLNEDNYMKFNIPDTKQGFMDGNGEGVWGHPLTDKDKEIYDRDTYGEKFEVVLLNNSIYFPFLYGFVLTAETRGESRPVLSYDWLDERIRKSEDGLTLDKILEGNG